MTTPLRALLLGLVSLGPPAAALAATPLQPATPAAPTTAASAPIPIPARARTSAAADAPVTMNPFGVLAEQFEIQVHLIDDQGTRHIDRMNVGPVTKNSLAARAGLREGMQILSIYGVPVSGRLEHEFIKDYVAHHDSAKLTLTIVRFLRPPRTIEIVWPPKPLPPL